MPASGEQTEAHSISPQPKSRRARLRTTTGCVTCRRRHVKCDEGKPTCANCAKKGRPCQYVLLHDLVGTLPQDPQRSRFRQRYARHTETESTSWGSESGVPEPVIDFSLDAAENTAVGDEQSKENNLVDSLNPLSDFDSEVSPFLATLGSILLYADTNDVQGDRPQLPTPVPSRPTGQVDDVDVGTHEVLRTGCRAKLEGNESAVFRNYVDNVSLWVDSFSRDQPFHRLVPNLALQCPVLLHACMALSAKQLNLMGLSTAYGNGGKNAVYYYRLALNAIRKFLLVNDLARSDEVLAACIALSTYEMLDVVGDSLGSHLVGVASLLESRQVYGDADGIRGACYWTWYRHEVWTALRTGRCLSLDESYWSPPPLESFEHLQPEDIANRVIFLFGQCVNYCNDTESRSRATADEWLRTRLSRTQYLRKELSEWRRMLPSTMLCFSSEETNAEQMSLGMFGSILFLFPQSAVANQVYHASRILLCLHGVQAEPLSRGLINCSALTPRRKLEEHRKEIFLTANATIPNPWSLVSCQCLYIAGLVTEGTHERQQTLKLLDQCQRNSGRKTGYLSTDLQRHWESQGSDDIYGL